MYDMPKMYKLRQSHSSGQHNWTYIPVMSL